MLPMFTVISSSPSAFSCAEALQAVVSVPPRKIIGITSDERPRSIGLVTVVPPKGQARIDDSSFACMSLVAERASDIGTFRGESPFHG